MNKLLLSLALLISYSWSFSQSVTCSYFEVHTKLAHSRSNAGFSFTRDSVLTKIVNVPDTASTYATFVVSVNDPAEVDSLIFTLTNSLNSIVYSGGGDFTSLQSDPNFRINGKTIYYKVGPYPNLKRLTATTRVRGNDGQSTPTKSFIKN
jgi:hypothetical protein